MSFYRNLLLSALVASAPLAASAGGLSPAVEQTVAPIIIDEAPASSSAQGLIVPLIVVALLAVAVAGSDANDGAKSIVTE